RILVEDGAGAVDRHGEADSDAALRAIDHGVDPDGRAVRIEQRPAAVPRIDGRVGLDHVLVGCRFAADRAAHRAHYAGGQSAFEAEGVADGDDFLTHYKGVGVAQL